MAAPFSYQPLPAKSIRVIKLLPSRRPSDPLRCTIQNLPLDIAAAQPYEALSYVWGEPTRQHPLDCDGKEFLVTKNCHEALVSLRRRFLPRTLWIDAICINQGSTDEAITERNGQVAMMGEIYLKAARVLIWLGPADAFVPALFRYLRSLHFFDNIRYYCPRLSAVLEPVVWRQLDIKHGRPGVHFERPYISTYMPAVGFLFKNKTSQLLESLATILSNPWFERVWTLQEVAFARKCLVIHGQHTLDWESLCIGYLDIPSSPRDHSHPKPDLLLSRWHLYLQLRGRSLDAIPPSRFRGDTQVQSELQLLAQIPNMKATVPHDRLYSVHALFQTMGLTLPSPDYRKDIATVFEEATISYIRCRQNLDIITLTPPPDEASGFPSWVPDWLTPGRYTEPRIWKIADFNAKRLSTANNAPILTENTGNGKLGVMGKTVGRIKTRVCCPLVGEASLSKEEFHQEFVKGCLDWRRLVDGLAGYPSGKDPALIARTLLGAYHRVGAWGTALKPWYRWVVDGGDAMPALGGEVLDELMGKRRLGATWVVYVLDSGYCGAAAQGCRVGDVVSIIPPLNPLVLCERGRDRGYRIVTPAYCEGVMNYEVQKLAGEEEEIILV